MVTCRRKNARSNPPSGFVCNCSSTNVGEFCPFARERRCDGRKRIQTNFRFMKNDEFAFFNQQLAAMLRDGIPLEGALRKLCEEMRRGQLRDELQALEADLAKGTPMTDA